MVRIKNRRRNFVVHHDKIKFCEDRCIPLWLRKRRQSLLSLDDTIAYDAAEQTLDLDLDSQLFMSQDDDPAEASDRVMPVDDTVVPEPEAPVAQSPLEVTRTRGGRTVRPNNRFRDYILWST